MNKVGYPTCQMTYGTLLQAFTCPLFSRPRILQQLIAFISGQQGVQNFMWLSGLSMSMLLLIAKSFSHATPLMRKDKNEYDDGF